MSRRAELLGRAGDCYRRAELYAEAARCYREAGRLRSAGEAYQNAGDLANAAECFQEGGERGIAAALYEEMDRPEDAALCWESVGDLLRAGWVLAVRTARTRRAASLLDQVGPADTGRRLRRDLGIGVCRARGDHITGPLERALVACEAELRSVTADGERRLVEEYAVRGAEVAGRPDLAARVFAASYACDTRDVVRRWRDWNQRTLGDTFGVPEARE